MIVYKLTVKEFLDYARDTEVDVNAYLFKPKLNGKVCFIISETELPGLEEYACVGLMLRVTQG